MPNLGRVNGEFISQKKKEHSLRALNRKRAEEEAMRLMKDKSDMFERYLRKPRNSSIGFLALSNAEKKSMTPKRQSLEKKETQDILISPGLSQLESISNANGGQHYNSSEFTS